MSIEGNFGVSPSIRTAPMIFPAVAGLTNAVGGGVCGGASLACLLQPISAKASMADTNITIGRSFKAVPLLEEVSPQLEHVSNCEGESAQTFLQQAPRAEEADEHAPPKKKSRRPNASYEQDRMEGLSTFNAATRVPLGTQNQ
ncbi:MAG: hypothetical protein WA581_04945 [Candidatus Acidiferrales bacterium]